MDNAGAAPDCLQQYQLEFWLLSESEEAVVTTIQANFRKDARVLCREDGV